jgi:carboxymethylenebutenolidase
MCFDHDSRPPIAPIEGGSLDASEIELQAADGTHFAAYLARATAPSGAGMVVLPDVRGLHAYYRDLALRFAEHGVDAIAIDYFGRTAGIGDRGPDFDWAPHVPQTTYEGLRADVTAAVEHLRLATGVDRVFTMGFCMGGRLAFLTDGFGLGLAGVIGMYGWPVGPARNGTPAPADVAATFEAPVLAIFGGADQGIGPDAVAAFEASLLAAGVEHRVITYPGAPHSFFDRKQEDFTEASAATWDEVLTFLGVAGREA